MALRLDLRRVEEGVLEPLHLPYSLRDTLRVYSFGWMYWGSDCGLLEVSDDCVAEVCERGGRIQYTLFCVESPSFDAAEKLTHILGLREDLSEYHRVARGDPLVGGVVEAMPGLHLRATSIWAAFLTAVCQQNASFRQGWGMLYRLHILASPRLRLPNGRVYLATPPPAVLDERVLREAGLGYRARTVLEAAHRMPRECREVDKLSSIRGVGPYTTALTAVLACRDYSRLPLDRWLEALAREAYGVSGGRSRVEAFLRERFGRWVGLAAIHATIAFDAQPLRRALERLRAGLNKPGVDEPSPLTLWRMTPPQQ